MPEILVAVNVENGLPGSTWQIKQDPRYILAVVHRLRGHIDVSKATGNMFTATWNDGFVELEMPRVDGDYDMFLAVVKTLLESMAKVMIEVEWGSKFLKAAMSGGIAVPGPGMRVV